MFILDRWTPVYLTLDYLKKYVRNQEDGKEGEGLARIFIERTTLLTIILTYMIRHLVTFI